MKMNGRIAGLVLCGFLALFASSAWGEDCTPVVYAFRHAEDSSAFALNPVGRRHADLYPAMISAFQDTFSPKLCAVAKVYAATIADKPNHERSATNSYYTAKTLASDRMRGALPITTVTNVANPSQQLELYEYVGNGNTAPADPKKPELYSNPTADSLRAALLATAKLGQSSAIFWTSQGLQVLGGAIIKGFSQVPAKTSWSAPPRNAVYLFMPKLDAAGNITGFQDIRTTEPTERHPVASAVYVQCFNWVGATTQPDIMPQPYEGFIPPDGSTRDYYWQNYYCGFANLSSPGGKPKDGCDVNDPTADCGTIPYDRAEFLLGKICDTTDTASVLKTKTGDVITGTDIYGGCQGTVN